MPGKRHVSRKEKRLQKRLKRLHTQLGDDDEEDTDAVQKLGADPNVGDRGISTKVEDTEEEEPGEELDGSGTCDGGFDGDGESSEESDDEDYSAAAGDEEGVGGQDAGEHDEDGGSDEADDGEEVEGEGEEEDDDDDDEVVEDDGSASEARGQGGMAEKMAIILGQRVKRKTPVLAKRKTKLMKDMEDQKKAAKRDREAAAQKRAALNHQLYIPDHTHTEPERQLRRIATRGVVALFNAVTKARAAQAAEGAAANGSGKTGKAGEMSKKQFLEMLKSSTSKSSGAAKDSTTSTKASAAKLSAVAPPRTAEARSWAALDDGLMMDKAPKMNAFEDDEDDLMAGMDDVEYPDDAEMYDVDGSESFGEEDGRDRRKAPSAAMSKSIKGKSKLKKIEKTRRARK